MQTNVIVLAAGKGTRMRSNRAKVLHCIGGLPMISHVLNASLSSAAFVSRRGSRAPSRCNRKLHRRHRLTHSSVLTSSSRKAPDMLFK